MAKKKRSKKDAKPESPDKVSTVNEASDDNQDGRVDVTKSEAFKEDREESEDIKIDNDAIDNTADTSDKEVVEDTSSEEDKAESDPELETEGESKEKTEPEAENEPKDKAETKNEPVDEPEPDVEKKENSDKEAPEPVEDIQKEETGAIELSEGLSLKEDEDVVDALKIDPEDSVISKEEDTVDEAIKKAEGIKERADFFDPDPEIDAAVDDIVRSEGDDALAHNDAKLRIEEAKKKKKVGVWRKIANLPKKYWQNRPLRYGSIVGLVILLTAVILAPSSRYALLNIAQVRVSSSMTIIDSQTRLPLKDIHVLMQDKSSSSDEKGHVELTNLKLGKTKLVISKRGYADTAKEIVLGWGSNPIGDQGIVATGEQFTFVVQGWQDGNPITSATAVSGENSASADENGKIVLTIGEDKIANVTVKISADGYRNEEFSGDKLTDGDIEVNMVPSHKLSFVSNRDGQYDLYKIDLDGKNEEILLAATKKEKEVPRLLGHPTKNVIAFISSRSGEQNKDGFVLDGLYVINIDNGNSTIVTKSEQIQLIGWSGDRLVFLQVVEGTSRGNPERSKIFSYNWVTGKKVDLASANYFNDAKLINDTTYYAVSSFAVPQSKAKLYSIPTSGGTSELLLDKQVWNIYRPNHNKLLFSAIDQKWYELVDGAIAETSDQIAPSSKILKDSPNGLKTAWIETRDGKGVLLTSNTKALKEEKILEKSGISTVLFWANDSTIVYQIVSNDETADYVIELNSGNNRKITDVTASRSPYFNL